MSGFQLMSSVIWDKKNPDLKALHESPPPSKRQDAAQSSIPLAATEA